MAGFFQSTDGMIPGERSPFRVVRKRGKTLPVRPMESDEYRHLNAMLDVLSNAGANRAMVQPDPQDASLFAQGGEQAIAQMGPNPGQWPTSDPRGVMEGQQSIDQHLAVRYPQGQGSAYQLLAEQAKRRRAVEQALTAEMDRAQLAGERRGYGSVPYAYMDNQITTPEALQPTRPQSPEEIAARHGALNDVRNQGGNVNLIGLAQGQHPATADATVGLSSGDPRGANVFRQGAGQSYVDLQRQAIEQMAAGVDPAQMPRNTFQGQEMGPGERAANAMHEATRKAPILAHYRGLKRQREDTIAALARRRMEEAEARNMANAVGGFRQSGLTSRDALAAAMFGGIGGGQNGDQRQAAMDIAYPEVSQLAMRRRLTDAQVARDQAETNAINNPMQAVMRNMALNPNTPPEVQAMILNYLQQQGGGGKAPGAGPAPFPVDQFRQAGQRALQMSMLGPQLQAAQSPEQALELLANNIDPNDPQAMQQIMPAIANILNSQQIGQMLQQIDPANANFRAMDRSNILKEHQGPFNWLSRKFGINHEETDAEHAIRMKKVAILKKLQELAGGAPVAR